MIAFDPQASFWFLANAGAYLMCFGAVRLLVGRQNTFTDALRLCIACCLGYAVFSFFFLNFYLP